MNIKDLIISEKNLNVIAAQQQEELSYEVWMKYFSEITESLTEQIPQEAAPIDRISYLARQSYLVGFMQGVTLINDTIKSFAAEETEAG